MELYEKPIVLVNEELAEGVYAASGDDVGGATGTGGVSVAGVELIEEGNQWNKVNKYTVTINNTGNEDATVWSVAISVTSGTATSATIYNGYQASASLIGKTITIKPGDGGVIPAGGSIKVEVVVFYSSDSITVGK